MSDSDENYDAVRRFWERTKDSENWSEWLQVFKESGNSFFQQATKLHAPVTAIMAGLVVVTFFLQIGVDTWFTDSAVISLLSSILEPGYLRAVTAWIFHQHPYVGWPLSPFLHKGIQHFSANLVLLALFGKYVEPRFKTRYFVLWFLAVTLVTKPVDAWISLQASSKEFVAVYGISDFVYSLSFFSVVTLWSTDYRKELQTVVLVIGLLSIVLVGLEISAGLLTGSVQAVNWSHLIGGILGIVVAGLTAK